jgi:putative toxin-antitoxin system antitoxin component (TIGR02293 family)
MTAQLKLFKPKQPSRQPAVEYQAPGGKGLFVRLGLAEDRVELVRQVQQGFPVAIVEKLAGELQLSQQALLKIVRIAPATLGRRRKSLSGRLSAEESDRVYRVAEAYRDSLQLFEWDADAARRWLLEPAKALGGVSPFQHLDTEAGAGQVRDLIGRLEHGVYS